jgi:hypothetical protein
MRCWTRLAHVVPATAAGIPEGARLARRVPGQRRHGVGQADAPVGIGMSGQDAGPCPAARHQPRHAGGVGGQGAKRDRAAIAAGQAQQRLQRGVEIGFASQDHIGEDEAGEDLGHRADLEASIRCDRQAGPAAAAGRRMRQANLAGRCAAKYEHGGASHRTRDRNRRSGQQLGTVSRLAVSRAEQAVLTLTHGAPRAAVQPDAERGARAHEQQHAARDDGDGIGGVSEAHMLAEPRCHPDDQPRGRDEVTRMRERRHIAEF